MSAKCFVSTGTISAARNKGFDKKAKKVRQLCDFLHVDFLAACQAKIVPIDLTPQELEDEKFDLLVAQIKRSGRTTAGNAALSEVLSITH